jgi:uncharacterized membrane protein YraQ (UPF0718 family)
MMDVAETGMIIIVAALYVAFSRKDAKVSAKALTYSYNMGLDIFILFTAGIAIVGAMMVLLPGNIVIATLGRQTGLWGILIGVAIGSVLPAGGYIRLPVVLALLTLGAGVGTVVAILATRSLLYLPQSIGFFGARVEAILTPSFLLSGFSAGLFAHFIAGIFL